MAIPIFEILFKSCYCDKCNNFITHPNGKIEVSNDISFDEIIIDVFCHGYWDKKKIPKRKLLQSDPYDLRDMLTFFDEDDRIEIDNLKVIDELI